MSLLIGHSQGWRQCGGLWFSCSWEERRGGILQVSIGNLFCKVSSAYLCSVSLIKDTPHYHEMRNCTYKPLYNTGHEITYFKDKSLATFVAFHSLHFISAEIHNKHFFMNIYSIYQCKRCNDLEMSVP